LHRTKRGEKKRGKQKVIGEGKVKITKKKIKEGASKTYQKEKGQLKKGSKLPLESEKGEQKGGGARLKNCGGRKVKSERRIFKGREREKRGTM